MNRYRGVLAVGLLLCLVPLVQAAEEQAEVQLKSVSLFKNGLGFFRSDVALPGGATTVRIGQLPVPAYGTFWVSYPEDLPLRGLVTEIEEFEQQAPAHSVIDLLRLNAGRKVTLHTTAEAGGMLRGTLVEVAAATVTPPASPYFMSTALPGSNLVRVQPPGAARSGFALLQTPDGLVAVDNAAILRVDFAGDGVVTQRANSIRRPSLRLELESPSRDSTVQVSWLAKGITWVPSYLIDLSDPQTARLTAKALVINEVMDLEGVALNLITGFPNIKFGEVRSPLAKQEPLAEFLRVLASGSTAAGSSGARGNVMSQQARLADIAGVAGWESAGPVGPGTVSEDLFLYPVEPITLKRGETAYIPVFTAELPYRHIYTWQIADYLDGEGRYRAHGAADPAGEEVWHSCRLENTLDLPLTTAAAEFVSQGQFVGQDVAYYTPPGARTTIHINRALNVVAEPAEVEESRERGQAKFFGYNHDLVTVSGELKLRSRLDKEIRVEVTKELSGEVLSMEPDGKDVKTAKGLRRVNPRHRLVWEVDLAAGESTTIRYRYQVYVRN